MSVQEWIRRAYVVGAVFAGVVLQRAADKIELKGSTVVELPKPARSVEEPARFKFETSGGYENGGLLAPPSTGNNGPLDRKLKEMMDKKKNWIFVNPYEQKFDDRTSEILEKDKSSSTSPMEHPLLQKDDKTLLEKFVEEKDGKRRSSDSPSSNSSDGRPEKAENNSQVQNGATQLTDSRKDDKPVALFFGAENSMFKERDTRIDDTFQKRMERTPFENSAFSQNRFAPVTKPDREELGRQQDTRDAEFNNILQNRGFIGAASPTAESRLESAFHPTLSPARSGGSALTPRTEQLITGPRTDFSGGNRAGSFGSISSSLPNSSAPEIGDINTRISKTPSFLPGNAPAAAVPSGPAMNPSPFVRELPRRKF